MDYKFRVGIIKQNGEVISENFNTRSKAEDYILTVSDKEKIKRADILNSETRKRERVF